MIQKTFQGCSAPFMTFISSQPNSMLSVFFLLPVLSFLVVLGRADLVTILATDPKLELHPPGLGKGWDYEWACGQHVSTEGGKGANASFTFTGMEVTVNFLSYDLATMAQIWLDGVNVQRVDTHDTSVKTLLACKAVSWQSGILPWESHTVTVVPIADPLNRPYAEWVYLHSFEYVGERGIPSPVNTPIPKPPDGHSSRLAISTSIAIIGETSAGIVGSTILAGLAFFLHYIHQHKVQKRRAASKFTPSPLTPNPLPTGMLGSKARLSNWGRVAWKLSISGLLVSAAGLCAYALGEDQPLGAIKGARLSTLLLQLAGLLPQISISMLAYEVLHMGIAARLNGDGLSLGQIDATANGLSATAFLFGRRRAWHKGCAVRALAIALGILAGLLRFALAAYPLLPGGLEGHHTNISLTAIGEQGFACPDCGEMTYYLKIANTVTLLGNATLTGNFSAPGDAIIIPPFVDSTSYEWTQASQAGSQIETTQDTLRLTSCLHKPGTKPLVRTSDMEYITDSYGTAIFGLDDGLFRLSLGLGDFGPGGKYHDGNYTTMECQAELRRYQYLQDVTNGGPIKIVHEFNASYLPSYNFSWPGFVSYTYASQLQLEYLNDERVAVRDFLGMMVAMIRGGKEADNVEVLVGTETGSFRLDNAAIKLLLVCTTAAWTIGTLLLIFYAYGAGCVATGADSALLMAARSGAEMGEMIRSGCNGGEISEEYRRRVVRARVVENHLEISAFATKRNSPGTSVG